MPAHHFNTHCPDWAEALLNGFSQIFLQRHPLCGLLCLLAILFTAPSLLGGALLVQGRNAPIRQQGPLFLTVLAGFAGVAMMLRPTLAESQMLGALVGLLSGIFAAFAYLQVAALSRGRIESLPFIDGLLDPYKVVTV